MDAHALEDIDTDPDATTTSSRNSTTHKNLRLSLSGDPALVTAPDDMGKSQEHSPLLSSDDESVERNARDYMTRRDGSGLDRFEETKGFWYFVLLTIGLCGLQLAWAVEFSNGTPFLLSLGISKSAMALVWIAGPLSGTLVQPYIGVLSDNCRSPWGKRRPFMIVGTVVTIVALFGLSWSKELVGGFLGLFGADSESAGVKNTTIVVAVLFVYILDFAINTVQAALRAFILDCCPSHQQETANAMASRILGAGNILGYLSGYLNLKKHLSFFGNTQFKILCVIASAALAGFVLLSSAAIQERDPRLEGPATKGTGGVLTFFKNVFKSINRLPPQTRKVCRVQFFAWIGFFPQLFYSSSYVGDIYIQPFLRENPNMTPAEMDHLYEKATRIGTYALLCNAIVAVSTNVFLPFLIAPSYDAPTKTEASDSKLQAFLHTLIIPGLTLRRAWLGSHVVFALAMFSTLIVTSVNGATILIALIGIPWALTLWAPFAIISAEISKRDALRRARNTSNEAEDDVDQAGVILGIHNMAVTMPQIIATLASSVAFKFLQKPRGTPGDHSFAYVLAAGGVSTLVAAWLTSRIQDEVPTTEEGLLEEGDADHAPRSSSERPLMGNELARGMRDDGL